MTATQPGAATAAGRGAAALESGFQREEVHAAVRASSYTHGPDERGVALATEAAGRLCEQFGDQVLEWNNFRDETTLVIAAEALPAIATYARDTLGFALLSDISPCDWLDRRQKRFAVNYHLTRMVAGAPRLRLQVWVDEGEKIPSLISIYPTSDWHEREAFDFFGIGFTGREGLRRLIMPDDWVGHPLRKDYPMGGEPVKFTNSLREI